MPGVRSELYYEEEFQRCWPDWQNEVEKRNLIDVEISCSLDHLFYCLFDRNTPFQKKTETLRRYTDVQQTKWTDVVSTFPGFPSSFIWNSFNEAEHDVDSKACEASSRKVLFSCPGNALHPTPFRTEQVERCQKYEPGMNFTVEVCVLSSPMYCDRFRPIIQYTARSIDSETCRLSINYQIIYVAKVNFLLKKFIEGSARGGIEDSFQKWKEALQQEFPSGVLDLKTSKLEPKIQHKKDIKSHKLENLRSIIEEEEQDPNLNSGGYYEATALALLLLFIRVLLFVTSILHGVYDVVTFVPRKLASKVKYDVAMNCVLTGLFAFFCYLILSQTIIDVLLNDSHRNCNNYESIIVCFTVSVATGFLSQCFLNMRP